MSANDTVAIVTAADDGYVDFARDLIQSVHDAQVRAERPSPIGVHVVDLGLNAASRDALAAVGASVCPCPLSPPVERQDMSYAHQMSRCVKAALPQLVPGHSIYVWLDADCWVQNAWALDMLVRPAQAGQVAIVPELDRAYTSSFRGLAIGGFRRWYLPRLQCFGRAIANDIGYRPSFNAGAFGAPADSPLWTLWRERLKTAFLSPIEVCDQAPLNVAIYLDRVPVYPLPATVNWICAQRLPRVNTAVGRVTEPVLPFSELGIVHLTRSMFRKGHALQTLTGERITASLDYQSIRALRDEK